MRIDLWSSFLANHFERRSERALKIGHHFIHAAMTKARWITLLNTHYKILTSHGSVKCQTKRLNILCSIVPYINAVLAHGSDVTTTAGFVKCTFYREVPNSSTMSFCFSPPSFPIGSPLLPALYRFCPSCPYVFPFTGLLLLPSLALLPASL